MAIKISATVRNAMLEAVATAVNAGSGPGTIELRTGSAPATPETAATGTVLVTFVMADPGFEVAAGGSMDFDANPDLTATATGTGTAGYARVRNSNGTAVFDGSVNIASTGADFIITNNQVTAGQTVSLSSGTLSIP